MKTWLPVLLCLLSCDRGPLMEAVIGPEVVLEDGTGEIRHFPFLGYLGGRALISFSQHKDAVLFPTVDAVRRLPGERFSAENFYLSSMIERTDGTFLGVSYITQRIDAYAEAVYYWTSTDQGGTWQPHVGTLSLPAEQLKREANWGGILFHRTLIESSDGALEGTAYGNYASDAKYRSVWVRSPDGGITWSVVGTIAEYDGVGIEGYGEPVAARAPDGSLLAVLRTGNAPLYQARSLDDGRTWSAPSPLPGYSFPLEQNVDPELITEDGVMYLSYGDPQVHVLRSADSGVSWSATSVIVPSGSGYSGLRKVGPGKFLLVTDDLSETRIVGRALVLP